MAGAACFLSSLRQRPLQSSLAPQRGASSALARSSPAASARHVAARLSRRRCAATESTMGLLAFLGCWLLALSPVLAAFFTIIPGRGMMVIFMIGRCGAFPFRCIIDDVSLLTTYGSSFFWLLALLFSGVVWWMIPPLRETFLWAVPIGVALQVRYNSPSRCVCHSAHTTL